MEVASIEFLIGLPWPHCQQLEPIVKYEATPLSLPCHLQPKEKYDLGEKYDHIEMQQWKQ